MKQYLYGKQPVIMRLQQKAAIRHLFLLEDGSNKELVGLAKANHVPITFHSKKELDKMASGNHQGVIAEIDAYKTFTLEEVLASIPKDKKGLLVMVDGVTDPHNLGAIMRTADAVGVDGIIIKKHHAVGLTPVVAKVAAGAIESVKVAIVTNLTRASEQLKKEGYWIIGTDMDNAIYYRDIDYTVPTVIVVGSEGEGISRLVKTQCDHMASIPMIGTVSSLNVSVATAILLYEVYDQRQGK